MKENGNTGIPHGKYVTNLHSISFRSLRVSHRHFEVDPRDIKMTGERGRKKKGRQGAGTREERTHKGK